MFLYNSLTRKKQKFIPLNPPEITLYTCGPTVYNFAHIGNFKTYIFEDILKRTLILAGFKVRHVMNITDVGHLTSDADEGEDKMELAAGREKKSAFEIAEFYTRAFFEDFHTLNCLAPDLKCKATEHITEMVEFIKKLEKKGYTYKTKDGIYFDTSKFDNYGLLVGISHIEGIRKGERVEFKDKKNPTDFALWKFSSENAKRRMQWSSPWGTGFPGWHIECSAMAMKYLGETLDIHCGGEDHIAVHHTNEIAQSQALSGKTFARFWMHGKFLVVKNSVKMAKSESNFLTVKTLRGKGYDPLAFRYLCLTAHYRTQLEFDWRTLDFASVSLNKLKNFTADLIKKTNAPAGDISKSDSPTGFKKDFTSALYDDLNTPKALAVLWQVIKSAKLKDAEKLAFILYADKIFGLKLTEPKKIQELAPDIIELIKERELARKNKDYETSDEIREKLAKKGIFIEDTPGGTKWSVKK